VLRVIAGPDGVDTGCPPVAPATGGSDLASRRVAWLTGEEQWSVDDATRAAVQQAVRILDARGVRPMGETSMRLVESFDITTRYWRRSELSGAESQLQLDDWDRYRRAMERRDEFDIVVMPATACVAPPWRAMDEEDFVFTLPASLLGWPAITVPVRASEHDLPAAVQIVARGWHDDLVLAAGRAIEQDSVRTN